MESTIFKIFCKLAEQLAKSIAMALAHECAQPELGNVWLESQHNNRGRSLSKTAHNCRRGHRAHRAPRA